MIFLGLVLLVFGFLFGSSVLIVSGSVLGLAGLALTLVGAPGPLRGRWY